MITAANRALELRSRSISTARLAVLAVTFAGTLAIAAQVRIPLPFTPVPITLQTFVLYLGASWLGARVAIPGLLVYVGGALLGFPLLSGLRGGMAAFAGATGGYILGWLVAVLLVSRLVDGRRRSWISTAGAMALGSTVILSFGALHLGLLLRLSPIDAFVMGVAPFAPGDALKIFTASALVRRWPNLLALR